MLRIERPQLLQSSKMRSYVVCAMTFFVLFAVGCKPRSSRLSADDGGSAIQRNLIEIEKADFVLASVNAVPIDPDGVAVSETLGPIFEIAYNSSSIQHLRMAAGATIARSLVTQSHYVNSEKQIIQLQGQSYNYLQAVPLVINEMFRVSGETNVPGTQVCGAFVDCMYAVMFLSSISSKSLESSAEKVVLEKYAAIRSDIGRFRNKLLAEYIGLRLDSALLYHRYFQGTKMDRITSKGLTPMMDPGELAGLRRDFDSVIRASRKHWMSPQYPFLGNDEKFVRFTNLIVDSIDMTDADAPLELTEEKALEIIKDHLAKEFESGSVSKLTADEQADILESSKRYADGVYYIFANNLKIRFYLDRINQIDPRPWLACVKSRVGFWSRNHQTEEPDLYLEINDAMWNQYTQTNLNSQQYADTACPRYALPARFAIEMIGMVSAEEAFLPFRGEFSQTARQILPLVPESERDILYREGKNGFEAYDPVASQVEAIVETTQRVEEAMAKRFIEVGISGTAQLFSKERAMALSIQNFHSLYAMIENSYALITSNRVRSTYVAAQLGANDPDTTAAFKDLFPTEEISEVAKRRPDDEKLKDLYDGLRGEEQAALMRLACYESRFGGMKRPETAKQSASQAALAVTRSAYDKFLKVAACPVILSASEEDILAFAAKFTTPGMILSNFYDLSAYANSLDLDFPRILAEPVSDPFYQQNSSCPLKMSTISKKGNDTDLSDVCKFSCADASGSGGQNQTLDDVFLQRRIREYISASRNFEGCDLITRNFMVSLLANFTLPYAGRIAGRLSGAILMRILPKLPIYTVLSSRLAAAGLGDLTTIPGSTLFSNPAALRILVPTLFPRIALYGTRFAIETVAFLGAHKLLVDIPLNLFFDHPLLDPTQSVWGNTLMFGQEALHGSVMFAMLPAMHWGVNGVATQVMRRFPARSLARTLTGQAITIIGETAFFTFYGKGEQMILNSAKEVLGYTKTPEEHHAEGGLLAEVSHALAMTLTFKVLGHGGWARQRLELDRTASLHNWHQRAAIDHFVANVKRDHYSPTQYHKLNYGLNFYKGQKARAKALEASGQSTQEAQGIRNYLKEVEKVVKVSSELENNGLSEKSTQADIDAAWQLATIAYDYQKSMFNLGSKEYNALTRRMSVERRFNLAKQAKLELNSREGRQIADAEFIAFKKKFGERNESSDPVVSQRSAAMQACKEVGYTFDESTGEIFVEPAQKLDLGRLRKDKRDTLRKYHPDSGGDGAVFRVKGTAFDVIDAYLEDMHQVSA